MREQDGYRIAMTEPSSPEEATSLLRPYGVWAVISPFNFPLPLAAGPAAAALVTGNTVILKPSYQGYLSTLRLYEAFVEAGLPEDALHVLTGSGRRVGAQLVGHADVNGITFTGSHEVGMQILRTSADRDSPRPSICEMGGKNATIVSGAGDLDAAAMGVARAAFGYSGQKCSACSRVYVEDRVADDFLNRLCEVTSSLKVSNPVRRDAFTGPVINARAVGRFREAVTEAKRVGRVLAGGAVMEGPDTPSDQYLELTVAEVPTSSYLMEQELFLPFVAVQRVSSFNEALPRLNQGTLGLTAGLFSEDADEIATFLDEAQAGVLYVNRSAGATTGAWPGIQSFSGWRGSGTTSRGTGGYYYVQQYMREQSRTIMH
jgi:1-pyrroline-5-carboxylate dehydrogenase